ncbi:MAG: sulfite exporter TauE/SafE family protein, partial [Natronospirillum sp.]
FGMFAAPFLALFEPRLVPSVVLMLGACVSSLIVIREFRHVDLSGLGWALGGRTGGAIVAGATIAIIPETLFTILFAGMILVAVGLSISGWRLVPTRPNLLGAGLISGYMGTISSIGAPPMALVYQHRPGPTIRATMGAFLMFGAAASLIALAVVGRFGGVELGMSLLLLPPLLIGFWLSRFLLGMVDRGRARNLVLAVTAFAAVILLVRALR